MSSHRRKGVSERNLVPQYREHVVTRIHAYLSLRGNYDDRAPNSPRELERYLNQLLPDFTVEIVAGDPPFRLVRAVDSHIPVNLAVLSSGEAQLLTLGIDLVTIGAMWELEQQGQRVLLIDEPDLHLHPDLQVRFADVLQQVMERFQLQVVVATHSTTLLSALGQFGGERCSVIYLDRAQRQYRAQRFDAVLKEVASCLGGHVLMGPLFGAPLLLVEGDDDYRIWSQVPRHGRINLAVIPTNGEELKRYQKTLETVFSSLREPTARPMGYALLDGDKPLPQPNASNPQKFVRFLRLACHEAENLYLADEVLATMNTTWEEAGGKIAAEAQRGGPEKEELLAAAPTWDRRMVDIKRVMHELTGILDPKNVHWTLRVGRQIGRERPSGQLAGFLGDDLLAALWPEDNSPSAAERPAS